MPRGRMGAPRYHGIPGRFGPWRRSRGRAEQTERSTGYAPGLRGELTTRRREGQHHRMAVDVRWRRRELEPPARRRFVDGELVVLDGIASDVGEERAVRREHRRVVTDGDAGND